MKSSQYYYSIISMCLCVILGSCTFMQDYSCEEIEYINGKYHYPNSEKLFSGTCEILNQDDIVLGELNFKNGYLIKEERWFEWKGEVYKTVEMEYKEGYTNLNGFIRKFVIYKNLNILLSYEFSSFKEEQRDIYWAINTIPKSQVYDSSVNKYLVLMNYYINGQEQDYPDDEKIEEWPKDACAVLIPEGFSWWDKNGYGNETYKEINDVPLEILRSFCTCAKGTPGFLFIEK